MQSNFRIVGDGYMMTVNTQLCKAMAFTALSVVLTLSLVLTVAQRCDAQTKPSTPTNVAALNDPLPAETAHDGGSNNSAAKTATAPAPPDPDISPGVAKQLSAMQAEIEQLKAELKNRGTEPAATSPAGSATPTIAPVPPAAAAQPPAPVEQQASDPAAKPEKP